MLRKLASFKSIKSDFLLFTIPVLVIGFFLSGWISIQVVQKALEKDTLQAMSRKVDEAIHEIESIDESARRDMLLAMENPHFYEYFIPPKPLPDLAGDDSGRSEILAHQREKRKWLASMSAVLQKRYHILEACLIDKDGHEHLRVVRGINQPEEDFSTTEHEAIFFDASFALNKGEVVRSVPYISPDAGEWVMAYTSPVVMPDGSKPAFFHFEVPLNYFQEKILLADGKHHEGRVPLELPDEKDDLQIVVNAQGLLLFRHHHLFSFEEKKSESPHDHGDHVALSDYLMNANTLFRGEAFSEIIEKMQAGETGVETFRAGHKNYFIVFRGIPAFGWAMANIRSENAFLTGELSLYEIKIMLAGVGLIIVVIAILLIILGSGQVIRPLQALTRSADEMGNGRLDCEFANLYSKNEIGVLARSLRAMCKTLRMYQRGLQEKIAVRTEHLQIANEVLNDTIAQLQATKRLAEAASHSKSLFLANMSHEIRTPMNAILGMTHLCLQTDITPRQQDYLDKIYGASHALLRIIDDILDFSKIEAGKIEMESITFHLDQVLSDLSILITTKTQKKGLEVVFATARGVPHTLRGDPTRLGQVLTNLTNNAAKFTESGEIVLSIERADVVKTGAIYPYPDLAPGECVTLQFSVRDTGIGMTLDQMDRLFQSFSQADSSTTRKYGGTGLGLAISKRLIELMGGNIWVESEVGQGSTFFFTACFDLPEAVRRRRLLLPDDLLKKRVLVVDDNQASQEMLRVALESFSFRVTSAFSGMAGLAELDKMHHSKKSFDLLLLDWQMPDMDGVKTFHCLKSTESARDLPVLFMVPYIEQANVKRYIGDPQPEAYLHKPVQLSTLFDAVINIFGKGGILPVVRGREISLAFAPSKTIAGAQVLLVEDNEINQQVAKELLENMGVVVEIAHNGQEAVQRVEAFDSDSNAVLELVLMDIQMPVMDGYQATRTLRSMSCAAKLPIVAMTANVMVQDLARCWEVGMDDHIAKPIDPNKLFRALNKWIKPREREIVRDMEKEMFQPDRSEARTHRETDTFPVLPGINTESGLFHVGGNSKLLRSLLVKFSENQAHFVAEFEEAIAKGKMSEAQRMAHTLKGVAGTIGALHLQALAKELESRMFVTPDFVSELELVIASVGQLLEENTEENRVSEFKALVVDSAVLLKTLELLLSPVRKKRPKLCEPILEELARMAFPSDMMRDMDTLTECIQKYKMKDALPILESMIARLKGV